MRNAKGFTLIELLIVIAIIAILAAVLIPNLIGARRRAFDAAALQCARTIALAAESSRISTNLGYSFGWGDIQALDPKSCAENIEVDGQSGSALANLTFNVAAGSSTTITVKHAQGLKTFSVILQDTGVTVQ